MRVRKIASLTRIETNDPIIRELSDRELIRELAREIKSLRRLVKTLLPNKQ